MPLTSSKLQVDHITAPQTLPVSQDMSHVFPPSISANRFKIGVMRSPGPGATINQRRSPTLVDATIGLRSQNALLPARGPALRSSLGCRVSPVRRQARAHQPAR